MTLAMAEVGNGCGRAEEQQDEEAVAGLLRAARPFLRWGLEGAAGTLGTGEESMRTDPVLPKLLKVLRSTGAAECWHKHGTFLEHLQDVYRILKLWSAPDPVARCGLFHSAYSNSYVNLAIFQPDMERCRVEDLIGAEAEHLVHLFCVVPRHELIHDMLLFQFTDEELMAALAYPPTEYAAACRAKLRTLVPAQGLTVKHIRTGQDVHLSRSVVAAFVLLTMADFVDQMTGWQDDLFLNKDGTLRWAGNNAAALWPGNGKPGLYMSAVSRMGVLLNLILREVREDAVKGLACAETNGAKFEVSNLELPPVFDKCSFVLTPQDQIQARDLYWEAVQLQGEGKHILEEAKVLLSQACQLNPWIGEPHVLLAQVYLSQKEFSLAEREANKGLCLLLQWGTTWDKRISWEGWIAWSRVLKSKAQEGAWPNTGFGILNLGLVK